MFDVLVKKLKECHGHYLVAIHNEWLVYSHFYCGSHVHIIIVIENTKMLSTHVDLLKHKEQVDRVTVDGL